MKNLFLLDIDDTITKSENQHQKAFVDTMKAFGIRKVDQNWSSYLHHTDSYILKENYENNFDHAFDFSMIVDFESKMTIAMRDLKQVIEISGAKKTVDFFKNHPDCDYSFATGSLLKPALEKLDQTKIDYHQDLVVASNSCYDREGIVKQSIEQAKAYYKVDSFENIISIGDGIWDLKTARNLDLHFIGIGMKNADDFKREQIPVHIKDWNDFDFDQVQSIFGL